MRDRRCVEIRKAHAETAAQRSGAERTLARDLQDAAVARLGLLALLAAGFSVVVRLAVPAGEAPETILDLRLGAFLATCVVSLAVAAPAWWPPLPAGRLLG